MIENLREVRIHVKKQEAEKKGDIYFIRDLVSRVEELKLSSIYARPTDHDLVLRHIVSGTTYYCYRREELDADIGPIVVYSMICIDPKYVDKDK